MAYGMDELGSASDDDYQVDDTPSGLDNLDAPAASPEEAKANSDRLFNMLDAQGKRSRAEIDRAYAPQLRLWDDMADRLKTRRIGPTPAEQLFQLSGAFFKPTSYRGFGATLGNVMPVLAQQQEQQRTAADEAYDLQQKYMMGRAETASKALLDANKSDNQLAMMAARYLHTKPEATPEVVRTARVLYPNDEKAQQAYILKNSPANLRAITNVHVGGGNDAPGWQMAMDPQNNNLPYRINVRTGATVGLDGKPYIPKGYGKVAPSNDFNLDPKQQEAVNRAVAAGKLDITRLTRGNAKTVANALVANPDLDPMNIHAYAQTLGNPMLQRSVQATARIPELLQTVGASGKALGYDDVKFIGNLQKWKNGQLNDPAFVRYMTQRNDAILSMAGAFRGTGATDMATKLEEEAAAPTMSPRALDAWMRANYDMIKPQLEYNKNFEIKNPRTGHSVNTPDVMANQTAAPGNKKIVKTGTDKKTGKKIVQYEDGTIAYSDTP